LQHLLGVFFPKGKAYIADSHNHKIKVFDLKTQNVITVELVTDGIEVLWEPTGVLELNN
jgi:hypothetical protein